jgi:hypothetical protein
VHFRKATGQGGGPASGAEFVSILYLHVNEKALIVFEKIKYCMYITKRRLIK